MVNIPTKADMRTLHMLHHRTSGLQVGDSVAPPLTMTSTFHLPAGNNPAPDPSRIYARDGNPTVQDVEARLAILEAAKTVLFASGMAAYTAVFLSTVKTGDRVLVLSDGYYHVRTLLSEILSGLGVVMETCSAVEMADYPLEGIRLAVLESPTNPSMDVVDIAAFCQRAKRVDCLVAVDNTMCTPLLQRPLDLGADIVIASDTKAMSGHSDLLMGHVSAKDTELMEKIHRARTLADAVPGPFEAWMLARSLDTLELRLARMCDNGEAAAALLQSHVSVTNIRYPGLKDDPAYTVGRAQMTRPGFLMGVTFASQKAAETFIKSAEIIISATSFGGVHTSADRRARWGDDVAGGFLRLSIGCEPRAALLAAIQGGLAAL